MAEHGETPTVHVQVRTRGPLLSALDEYRRAQPDPPSRGTAARQILEKALLVKQQRIAKAGRKVRA
jgi:hypothetical protein